MEKMKLESANEYARKSSSDTKNKEDYCKHNVCSLVETKCLHKRTAYTAFWTKAPPGRKKNIPKGTASNG